MVRGEHGRQAHSIDELVAALRAEGPLPAVIGLSNVMLIGLARALKQATDARIVCTLQGEAPFLDALPEPYRGQVWAEIAERCADVDAFAAVSAHYGALMRERLDFPAARLHVVHNGVELGGMEPAPGGRPIRPVIGYLARMCSDKGLGTLVDAFVALKRGGEIPRLRLKIAGAMLPADRPYVDSLKRRLADVGIDDDVEFHPNFPGHEKTPFLQSLSVLSVPATYGESFGLFVLEALAHGVPVVEPRHGAFPEIVEATGGGLLCEPDDAASLADALRRLLLDRDEADSLAAAGRAKILEHFTSNHMAEQYETVLTRVA